MGETLRFLALNASTVWRLSEEVKSTVFDTEERNREVAFENKSPSTSGLPFETITVIQIRAKRSLRTTSRTITIFPQEKGGMRGSLFLTYHQRSEVNHARSYSEEIKIERGDLRYGSTT